LEPVGTIPEYPGAAREEKGSNSSGADGSSVIGAEVTAKEEENESRMIAISGNRILFIPDDSPTVCNGAVDVMTVAATGPLAKGPVR